jgi:predicted GNAT family acetyltransferase
VLDRPVWAALTTRHAALSLGDARARRYAPDVNLFASARDDTAEAHAALRNLVNPGEKVFVLQVPAIVVPEGFGVFKAATGVQMVATAPVAPDVSAEIAPLTDADAPEMLALATLTEPGPFLSRTHVMGRFLGVRIGGRLAAMAGERLSFPGFTEVSGVCTHPDFRGKGLARRLSATVTARIQARGEQPFLHAWMSNEPAIRLYESLGFEIRAAVDVKVLERVQ